MTQEFLSRDLSRRFGLTIRQLQYWDDRGLVSPKRIGAFRHYLASEAVMVGIVAELRKRHLHHQLIRKAATRLSQTKSRYSVINPHTGKAYACATKEQVLNVFQRLRCSAFLIDLDEIRRKVSE